MFLIICVSLLTLAGNSVKIQLICLDLHLHTSVHLLLSQLSLMDLIHVTTTVPNMAFNFFSGQKHISLLGCGTHSFFFLIMACPEGLLLASMAYDRFVAICHLLHYPVHMNSWMCAKMVIGSWMLGSINFLVHTVYTLHLPNCRSRAINHFCNVPAMLPLACMDTWVYEYMFFVSTSLFLLLLSFISITACYAQVLFAVFHMSSKEKRKKAFTMCSTHLTEVTLYYAPFVYTYLWPRSLHSPAEDKILAVFYIILTPMLNPFIYSLGNREVLGAMKQCLRCSLPRRNDPGVPALPPLYSISLLS